MYNQKARESNKSFSLFVLFHPGTHTTAVAFHALILFHFTVNDGPIPLGLDTQCLWSILDLSTMEPPQWFGSAAMTFTVSLAPFSLLLILSSSGQSHVHMHP